MCDLITKTYVTDVNTTTGVHVHVSAGLTTSFRLKTLQKLFAFLWAFEPQLDSLHPENRHNNNIYAKSLRDGTAFVERWYKDWGQVPTLKQGIVELLKKDKMEDLLEA